MKNILMIAFHYPPFHGSSSVHRTLQFSRHIRDSGFQPVVLTVQPRAYRETMYDQVPDIPPNVSVQRVFALDVARDLSLRGYYPFWLALIDPWWTWLIGAIPRGLQLMRRQRFSVIWSTFPILTSHLIGMTLHRLTGVPWIADFRDSMTEDGYPKPAIKFKFHRWLERKIVSHCTRAVFTTSGAKRMYAARYPSIPSDRWVVIENGYDEDAFCAAETLPRKPKKKEDPFILLHSGALYPNERDPRAFYASLADLRKSQKINAQGLRIVFRASGHDEYHRAELRKYGLEDIVLLEKSLPYREALSEMLQADALLIFQADHCNHMIPAKIYEYLRCRRPILALTDTAGDTAALLRDVGMHSIARLDSVDEISRVLIEFIQSCRNGTAVIPDLARVKSFSRINRTLELARLTDAIVEENARREEYSV